ncbi:MAG TPA: uroporphyrinogen-III synthase [Aggregatilineales bacterium]|nr:uroporphyrinogen-III synthase [Aggregatilineales bacterium]
MSKSLAGKRIVITRAASQSADFASMIKEAGGIPILFPTIEIEPIPDNPELDTALQDLDQYDWVVFTSANGVRIVLDRIERLGIGLSALPTHIAVIGPGTELALKERNLRVDLLPKEYVAEDLFDTLLLRTTVEGKRFLLMRADSARPVLREKLIEYGAQVSEVPVYRTRKGSPGVDAYTELRAGVDIITFTSSSTVKNFSEILGDEAKAIVQKAAVACIGPITAKTAREMGFEVAILADVHDVDGLLKHLEFYYRRLAQ